MAIYQYYLVVIPKEGGLKIHDAIPNEISGSTETGFFESDAGLYWKKADKNASKIISKIGLIIKRFDWGSFETNYNWKTYSKKVDNDTFISLDEKTLKINEFSSRAGLLDSSER